MQFKRDVQNEGSPAGSFPIGKVGITNVNRNLEIEISDKKLHFSINAVISAFISLPGTQRGIHMSRTAESIEEVINNAVFRPAKTVEEFCIRIIDALFRDHTYTNYSEVEMKGTLFISMKPNERDQIQRAYEIFSKVLGTKDSNGYIDKEVFVGVSAEGVTACPCAQEMSRDYAKEILKSRQELNLNEEGLEKVLNLIPIATHNQRAKGQIIIGNGEEELIDVLDLIEIIESSMSGKIHSILKRPDESELVRISHLNPKFVEDVVRTIAMKLAKPRFNNIKDKCTIQANVESQESIHYHNAYAEINTNFKEIRANFKGE